MEESRFKNLNDIKLYWDDGREHPLMDTLLFLVTYIEELEKNIRKLEGWRD